MVYIGNILKEYEELEDNFEIGLRFKSGSTNSIKKTDTVEKINGELKVTRFFKGKFLCSQIIDCAEVETLIIHKSELI